MKYNVGDRVNVEGYAGTVINKRWVKHMGYDVLVKFDDGEQCRYREWVLSTLDKKSAPGGSGQHEGEEDA